LAFIAFFVPIREVGAARALVFTYVNAGWRRPPG